MIKTIQVPKTVMEDRLQCDKCGETFHIAELLVAAAPQLRRPCP